MTRLILDKLILVGVVLALAGAVTYSQRPTGPLPDALLKTIDTKQESIKRALDRDPQNEWTGNYYSQDGPTAGTMLSWHPRVGFVVRWSTCSYGWRESVNHGTATLNNHVLTLSPELTGSDGNVYQIGQTLVPILWGQQHYLVWSNRLVNFCYAITNAANAPEVDAFFLKDADREKPRARLPNVPPQYEKYLFAKPIVTTISEIKPNREPWIKEFTLNVGTADGVVPEMKFYAFAPRNVHMLVEILDASEHSSRAYVITSGYRNSEKDVTPRVGWKLTSRAPSDASDYYP